MDALINDYDYDAHTVEKNRDEIVIVLAQFAKDALEYL